ncbi:hypothetical protein [Actimicrobium sp. CCI2.3]|uniref:hypothetical protein n=1 Tax=Actimicrobium sp. CCI2.3 TaxID=3048616 RepID=UPI002AB5701E|nr:hypothetical protein [Actimicrobium sp. CCI2.3]MDY7573925.1 hypothetical protein [Actimicrobium sp. CCI2.3]MEB0023057.1 hypothetical protein [Actimicrobium sp. CCI2.3]
MKLKYVVTKPIVSIVPELLLTRHGGRSDSSSISDCTSISIACSNSANNSLSQNSRENGCQSLGSLSEMQCKNFVKTKLKIIDHDDQIALLDVMKKKNKITVQTLQQLGNDCKDIKSNLQSRRKERDELEMLFDRQELITNLGCKKQTGAKARLFFIRKLSDATKIRLTHREEINKEIARTEHEFVAINKSIVEKELLVNGKRHEIAVLEKTITANAADLYPQVLRIKKDHQKIINQNEVDDDLKIKNGKYLLVPLFKARQFRSVGTQLSYQAQRMMRRASQSTTPGFTAQRLEI